MKAYNNKINETIADAIGYRRWRFGDKWVKGLQLADLRRHNKICKITENALAFVNTVKVDNGDFDVEILKQTHTPVSHWISPEGKISTKCPRFTDNLNAMHIAESYLTADEFKEYDRLLPLREPQKCHNTPLAKAICWLRAKGLSYN